MVFLAVVSEVPAKDKSLSLSKIYLKGVGMSQSMTCLGFHHPGSAVILVRGSLGH